VEIASCAFEFIGLDNCFHFLKSPVDAGAFRICDIHYNIVLEYFTFEPISRIVYLYNWLFLIFTFILKQRSQSLSHIVIIYNAGCC
jgi:hypothetical protein